MEGDAVNRRQLAAELSAAGVPAMAVGGRDGRVALGPPFHTATGQWVVLADGTPEWVGPDTPTPVPDAALITKIAAVRAAHVPAPPPPPPVDQAIWRRAVTKLARGRREATLTAEEREHLNRAAR